MHEIEGLTKVIQDLLGKMGRFKMWKMLTLCIFLAPSFTYGIEISPTPEQIQSAQALGKDLMDRDRENSEILPMGLIELAYKYQLGTGGSCNSGDIYTKLREITDFAYYEWKKYKLLDQKILDFILQPESLKVSVNTCYSNPGNTNMDHLIFKQDGNVLQPLTIKQTVSRSSSVYINRIEATFPINNIKPREAGIFVVIPPIGEEMEFEADLSVMP